MPLSITTHVSVSQTCNKFPFISQFYETALYFVHGPTVSYELDRAGSSEFGADVFGAEVAQGNTTPEPLVQKGLRIFYTSAHRRDTRPRASQRDVRVSSRAYPR